MAPPPAAAASEPWVGEWRGEFHQFSYGVDARSPLILRVSRVEAGELEGTLSWPAAGDAVTTVRGRIEGAAVSFTETGYLHGADLVLHGRYMAQLGKERTLRGEWFDPKTGAEGGRFVLHRRPGTRTSEEPDTLIARGVIAAPGPLLERLEAAAKRFNPSLPPIAGLAPAALQWALGFGSAGTFDLDRPMHVALFTPQPYDELPLAVMLPTRDVEALVATLPPHARPAGGNAWSFETGPPLGVRIYLNLIGDWAVVTGDARLFPRHRAFFERLRGEAPTRDVSLRVALSNVVPAGRRGRAAQVDEASEALARWASVRSDTPMPPAAMRPYVAWAIEVARQCEVIELAADVRDDGMLLHVRLPAIRGTPLATALAAAPGVAPPEVFDRLPVDSVLAGFFQVRGPSTDRLVDVVAAATGALRFPEDAAKAARMRDALKAHWKALGAGHAFAVHPPPAGQKLTLVELHEVVDAAAARETRRVVARLQADPGAAWPDWAGEPRLRFEAGAYVAGGVPVDVVELSGYADRSADALDRAMDTTLSTVHVAYAGARGVTAYGDDARADIERFLAPKLPGGFAARDDVRRGLGNAVPRPVLFVLMDPLALLARADPARGRAYGLITGPHAAALALSAGVDDGAFAVVVDLPFEPFVQLGRMQRTLDL